jgi:hypothetical protein
MCIVRRQLPHGELIEWDRPTEASIRKNCRLPIGSQKKGVYIKKRNTLPFHSMPDLALLKPLFSTRIANVFP